MSARRHVLVGLAFLLAAPTALAQSAPTTALRGVVASMAPDGASLTMTTRAGETRPVRLTAATEMTLIVRASLADVKPGAFVGVAALQGEGDSLRAMEVHIFPEAMRGTGAGFRPYDLAPGSSMTNGDVAARVEGVDGPRLTVTYAGGKQTIVVDATTPIVSFAPGARADLKPGAAIIVRGAPAADGALEAARVLVGKDGVVPPM